MGLGLGDDRAIEAHAFDPGMDVGACHGAPRETKEDERGRGHAEHASHVSPCGFVEEAGTRGADGAAWLAGDCGTHVQRGGAWGYPPDYLRTAVRGQQPQNYRYINAGMRVLRELAAE